MSDESMWIERAQSAEAREATLKESNTRIKEDSVHILETFAARKQGDGSFKIDFEKFIENIGESGAAELRQIIDEQYPAKLSAVK